MRFELHLILWVTAALVLAAGLFVGRLGELQLGSLPLAGLELTSEQTAPALIKTSVEPGENPRSFPDIDVSSRTIFPVDPMMIGQENIGTTIAVLPALLGIFSVSGDMVAMVSHGEMLRTELVEEGEAVGAFVVRRISEDGIILEHAADGRQEAILLRGAGELP